MLSTTATPRAAATHRNDRQVDPLKGVGVCFCTQNPMDVPDGVLGQLGLKVQHALRLQPGPRRIPKTARRTTRSRTSIRPRNSLIAGNKGRPSSPC